MTVYPGIPSRTLRPVFWKVLVEVLHTDRPWFPGLVLPLIQLIQTPRFLCPAPLTWERIWKGSLKPFVLLFAPWNSPDLFHLGTKQVLLLQVSNFSQYLCDYNYTYLLSKFSANLLHLGTKQALFPQLFYFSQYPRSNNHSYLFSNFLLTWIFLVVYSLSLWEAHHPAPK